MRAGNVVQEKSFAFTVRIVNAYKFLRKEKQEFILSKQLLRCETSIGANVEEAIGAHSKADFVSKMTIAYKEARETLYWIKLLLSTEFFSKETAQSLINDAEELCKIISKILTTTKHS